jgi:hypothetical protein
MKKLIRLIREFFYGRRVKGEPANYKIDKQTSTLKKWKQQ